MGQSLAPDSCCNKSRKSKPSPNTEGYYGLTDDFDSYDVLETTNELQSIESMRPQDKKERIFEYWRSAITEGNDSFCVFLHEENPELNLVNYIFPNGDSSLQTAVLKGHNRVIILLLEEECNVNIININNGNTALHYAVKKNGLKLCTILYNEYNANDKIKNLLDKTPLDIAKDNNFEDIIELLSSNYDNFFIPQDTLLSKESTIYTISENSSFDEGKTDDTNNVSTVVPLKSSYNKKVVGKRIRTETLEVIPKFKRTKTLKTLRSIRTMSVKRRNLPVLEGWLKKKSPSILKGWQERWFTISDGYLFYLCQYKKNKIEKKQAKTPDKKHKKNKNEYNGVLSLLLVKDIIEVKDKQNTQFCIIAREKKKNSKNKKQNKKLKKYLIKAKDKEERDKWIEGLKKHVEFQQGRIAYLDNDFAIY